MHGVLHLCGYDHETRRRRDARAAGRACWRGCDALRLRGPRRPPQRGQVHAGQPHRGRQGGDRLRQAADHAARDPRHRHGRGLAARAGRPARRAAPARPAHRAHAAARGARAGRLRRRAVRAQRRAADRRRRPLHRRRDRPGRAAGGDRAQQGRPARPPAHGGRALAARRSSACRARSSPSAPAAATGWARWWTSWSSLLPEGPFLYPPEDQSDLSEKVRLAELVREQVLLRTREEVPHAVEVELDEIEEREDGLLDDPRARLDRDRVAEGDPGRRRRADGQGGRHAPPGARSRRCSAAASTSSCRCACARAGVATRRCWTGWESSDRAHPGLPDRHRGGGGRRGPAAAARRGAAHAEPAAGLAAKRRAGGGPGREPGGAGGDGRARARARSATASSWCTTPSWARGLRARWPRWAGTCCRLLVMVRDSPRSAACPPGRAPRWSARPAPTAWPASGASSPSAGRRRRSKQLAAMDERYGRAANGARLRLAGRAAGLRLPALQRGRGRPGRRGGHGRGPPRAGPRERRGARRRGRPPRPRAATRSSCSPTPATGPSAGTARSGFREIGSVYEFLKLPMGAARP